MKLDKRNALALFRLGTDLVGKLPRRGDGPLDVLVKLLAVADSIDKVYGGKSTVYDGFFARFNLQERTSEPFVRLFFGTKMASGFKIRRYGISEHYELIEAEFRGERLFFQEMRYGRPEISGDFFHSPGFDFAAAMSALWAGYPHGLFLSVKPNKGGWGMEVTFSAMAAPQAELVSHKAARRIAEGAAAWRARAGTPWCFLAYGPPGTGKTGYVRGLAEVAGGRLLKLDASSLPRLGVQELTFLLDALAPSFLLVDDFDLAPVEEVRPRLLYLFEHLHGVHNGVTVAITVNDAAKLDEAMLRSERIDEAEEFVLPDAGERADILGRLTALHVPDKLDADHLAELVTATEGFNHADLAALVRRFKTKVVAAALRDVQKLRALAAASAKKDEKGPDSGSPPKAA